MGCENAEEVIEDSVELADPIDLNLEYAFGDAIDFDNLPNYANQEIPNYIDDDNTRQNTITDLGATLGRVLFYDKNLSVDNTISCASCHKQSVGFSDEAIVSVGVNGTSGRHAMRLINARFSDERRFFWDEIAVSLEEQTTMPIRDHAEMGFSGANGDPGFDELLDKMETIAYYPQLFTAVYGDSEINEERMQETLAQFIRSIQSFDSEFDTGLAQTGDVDDDFPNYTDQENLGKALFLNGGGNNNNGGAGCDRCHRAPEFGIEDDSDNNGVIGVIGDPEAVDLTITRSPTLRDLVNPQGELNDPLMHTGEFASLREVIDHYSNIPDDSRNNNLDRRLDGPPLRLCDNEKDAIVAFLETFTGTSVYTDPKYSDPFIGSE